MNIEYKMSKAMFQAFLRDRPEDKKRGNPYTYMIDVINEQFGLKGKVTRVIIEEE